MDFKFIKSPNRFYYMLASLRYGEMPSTIYEIVHSKEYLYISKQRRIYDNYCSYVSRQSYRNK